MMRKSPNEYQLVFPDYPEMKIGFSTQNFMKCIPFTAESMNELLQYASEEGYQFIELRDNEAQLSVEACKALAEVAGQLKIEVIYEINLNLLHPQFWPVFERGLRNTLEFSNPGILRVTIALSEFSDDPSKTGWSPEELKEAAILAEKCAKVAREQGVTFVVENIIEPFFGSAPGYYGLSDLFDHTELVGLQYDLCNPFASVSRRQAEPDQVASFLASLGDRWVTTHIKTSIDGVAQPVLGDCPLTIPEVTRLMGKVGVKYFALELVAVEDREECFKNHSRSISYLKDLGIVVR